MLVVVLLLATVPSMGLANQKEPLRVRTTVPAGLGQELFIPSSKGNKRVAPKNVTRKFQPADGFPQAAVNEFTQSANGTIWMATEVGLYCYDGYQVQHFDTGLLKDASCVCTIVHDGHEEIWLGTKTGLAMLSIGQQQIVYLDQFRGTNVYCIGVDHLGRLIVGTTEGLFVYVGEDFLKVESSTSKFGARSIETDQENATTWIGTDRGLFTLQDLRLEPQSLPHIDDSPVCKLHLDRFGALWVGTNMSVLRVKSGNVIEVHSEENSLRRYVRDFAESELYFRISLSNKTLSIASDQLSGQLNADSFKPVVLSRKKGTRSSFVDRDGNFWTGSLSPPHVTFSRCGLQRFTNQRCHHILRQPQSDTIWFSQLPTKGLHEVVRMQDGVLKQWQVQGRISCLVWHNDRILIGTDHGVFQLDGDKVVPHPRSNLSKRVVFNMATGPDGSLWVATNVGVYRISENKIVKHDSSDGFGTVVRVLPWEHGLTLATSTKIRHYDNQGEVLEEIDFAQDVAQRPLVELLRTNDGRFWVGTSCGLFSQERVGEPLRLVREHDRFLGLFLTDANDGKLWAGTLSGPCLIDRETKVMQSLLPEDISGPQRIFDCVVDGDFAWFTGEKGLFRCRTSNSAPELVIDRVTSDRELAGNQPVLATTDNKLLTVSFHAITPGLRNGSTLYRYRLRGQSDQWSETRRNEIELRDLPVGDYSLELQAFDINLAASSIVTIPVSVSVPALRYATYGAMGVSLLLVLLSAGYVFRYQRQQNKIMAKQVSEAVSEQLRLEEGLRQVQKLESLGTLASGMAHDFNNVLQVVSMCSEMATLANDHDVVAENMTMIRDAASQAQGLTRSMLTLAGNRPQQSEVVDLGDLTSDCLAMIRQTFPQSIEIEQQRVSEDPMLVQVDPEQIKQSLINLFLNARDAMPSGGILSVSIQSITKDRLAQVEVRDSGSGIPPENLERIFEPFYTTKPRGKGTGLGLAMAQGIIRGHNGSITVESTEGHGTCFTLCLPLTTNQQKEPARRPKELVVAAGDTSATRNTVLVAEDREQVRDMLVNALEGGNSTVFAADNGAKALELAYKERPDVFVLDVDMPILDGLTVLRKIRSSGYDAPAIIISGAPVQASLPSNTVVLLKPFTSEQLREAAASHVH